MVTYTRTDANGGQSKQTLASQDYGSPDLPSYQHPDYRHIAPQLELSNDVYRGLSAWVVAGKVISAEKAVRYLPREEKERPKAYGNRLQRSLFTNFYRPAIRGFAGLLSDFTVAESTIASIKENVKDVNLQGDNLHTFLCLADELVLRDGFCGVLVDFPAQPTDEDGEPLIRDREMEERFNLRPYTSLMERKDILNWRTRYINGRLSLEQCTIRRTVQEPVGLFGVEEQVQYQVWFPGGYELWVEQEEDGKTAIVKSGMVEISLPVIPIVLYSYVDSDPFCTTPPLYDLALMNISHYQLYSDYREVMHKCNLPVPVRKGLIQAGMNDYSSLPPIVIGANSGIDVTSEGDFYFAEPTGNAIGTTRQAIADLEAGMLREALNFFGADDSAQKTVKEVELRSAQTRASLLLMAQAKESAVEEIFSLWSLWMNKGANGGGIEINKSLLSSPLTPQAIQVFSSLVTLGQLDLETFIQILRDGKAIPKEVQIPDLMQRVGANVRPVAALNQSSEVLNNAN